MGIGIREARNALPTLVKRAARNEDIQLGSRGADEVTLVSTAKYQRLRRELDRARAELARLSARPESGVGTAANLPPEEEEPFAALQRALEEGRLSLEPDDTPRIRTYYPDYSGVSTVSREERIRFGSNTPEPKYRRTEPRA